MFLFCKHHTRKFMYRQRFLKEIIYRFMEEYQNKEAFFIYEAKQIVNVSYYKFGEDILKVAGYFFRNRIRAKHIALATKNSYEWFVVFFAILVSGNKAVLLNQDLPAKELLSLCTFADVSFIFADVKLESLFCERQEILLRKQQLFNEDMLQKENIYCPEKKEFLCLLFTSGTLGANKGVMLSAQNIQICMSDLMDIFHVKKTLLVLPLYHMGGLGGTLYLLAGGKTVCIGRGLKYIFQDLPRFNPNHVFMVPGIMNRLVKLLKRYPDREIQKKYIGTNLKYLGVGGAVSDEKSCMYLIDQGFELSTGYGLSETAGSVMMGIVTKDKIKSLGKLVDGVKCRIKDGEILLSGNFVMLGYYKEPEITRKVIQDGWFYTGDLGYCDKDGWYYLTGRKKNVIILSNGENVSPEQIEGILNKCEVIIESMVYSIPKGICADVYTKEKLVAERYVKEYNENVPTYRQILYVNYYSNPLKKTGSGKIIRKENRYE